MANVPDELKKEFHNLLDQISETKDRNSEQTDYEREGLDTYLDVLSEIPADLPTVLKVLQDAWHEKTEELRVRKEMRLRRERYEKQQQGQRAIAKAIPLLEESLSPTDPNWFLLNSLHCSTLHNTNPEISPPQGPTRRESVGNPQMPWIAKARERLRQAGVSEEETRESLLSIFDLKRRQKNTEF